MLRLKRAYEPAVESDGYRILVDRLWPRGLSKEKAAIDDWIREIAPTTELRQWFRHDPKKWREFQRRYKHELRAQETLLCEIARLASRGPVTLVYAARDEAHNEAIVIAAAVRSRIRVAKTVRANRVAKGTRRARQQQEK